MNNHPPKNTEIEKKFLVDSSIWKNSTFRKEAKQYPIKQGYLCTLPNRTVRIRLKGEKAFLTIKGAMKDLVRSEFEYSVPIDDAQQMLATMTDSLIEKTRFVFAFKGYIWEVDEFEGVQAPLIIAEVELGSNEETPVLPSFIREEVSMDMRYTNSQLSKNPYSSWNA